MKRKVIIITCLTIIILIGLIIGMPLFKEQIEIKKLEQEVVMVNNYLEEKETKEKLLISLEKEITSSKLNNLENHLELYLKDVMESVDILKDIKKNEKVLINELKNKENIKDYINYLKERNDKLNALQEQFKVLNNKEKDFDNEINDEQEITLYKEMISKIDLNNFSVDISKMLDLISNNKEIANFLNDNKEKWQIEDETIVFLKRKKYDEYQKMQNNTLEYSLIVDKKAPKITALDISIYKGNKINLKDKVNCYDEVDDNTECKISGSYDTNKVGTYNIKITSTDKANNNAIKTIKLSVKEKKVNKKPYYIEVIRNHNVVIVYGLDKNNEYTKIVKVFTCSVGINGKTPTGTFKTSDKASWGRLVGNVYGQYYTRITGNILFHSVPYFKKSKSDLEWEEYNKLGTAASKGCVRLAVKDVKWLYSNCPSGTIVKIYDGNIPNGVIKPSAIKISASSPNRGWDPTDPDKNNPWNK